MRPNFLHRYLEYVASRRYYIIQVFHSKYVAPLLSPHPEHITTPLLSTEPSPVCAPSRTTHRETRQDRSFRRGLFLGATGSSLVVLGYIFLLLLYDSAATIPLPEPPAFPSPTLMPSNPKFVSTILPVNPCASDPSNSLSSSVPTISVRNFPRR